MLWEHANGIDGGNYGKGEGIAFIGNNGTLVVNRGGWEVIPERDHRNGGNFHIEKIPKKSVDFNALDAHTKNFIDCIKNNDPNSLNCGIESGSIAAINAHMGNIAYKTGNKIYWNKERGNFGYDYKANSLITPKYNNGWKLPKI